MHRKTVSLLILLTAIPYPRTLAAQQPSSERSIAAIQKVKPRLEKALSGDSLKWGSPIFIRIFKESKELELWIKKNEKYELFRIYAICYYSGKLGPKLRQGDNQSPEGFYYVSPNQLNPWSQFHLSFNIGYPNKYDRSHKRTGSAIMIHGNCVSIGCYAMTDESIEEIYALADAALRNGQSFFRAHIFPFRMTHENMDLHKEPVMKSFWLNLMVGFDYFEEKRIPPNVDVRHQQYIFSAQ